MISISPAVSGVTTVEKATAAKGRAPITSGTQPVQAKSDQAERVGANCQGLVHHGVRMPAVQLACGRIFWNSRQ